MRFKPGDIVVVVKGCAAFYYHTKPGSVGKVVQVDPKRDSITIDFHKFTGICPTVEEGYRYTVGIRHVEHLTKLHLYLAGVEDEKEN
jgi:hypothetical protein